MKVKIAHSVDMEKLTDEFSKISSSCVEPLKEALETIEVITKALKIGDDESLLYAEHLIDKFRKRLTHADETAAEASVLIQGYIKNFINFEKPVPPPEPIPPEQPESTPRVWDSVNKRYYDSDTTNPIHNSEDV